MMKKRLPEVLEEMRQAVLGRRKDHRWGESASEAYSAAVGGIKDFSGDTLTKTAQRFNEAMPYIERAGYDVTEIEVGLGLSPKIVPHLRLRELIDEEEQIALLEETREKKLINTILSSLFRAASTRKKLKFNRFHFTDLELEISILPTVVLRFKPNENHMSDPALLEDETSSSEPDTPPLK
jgi:hypothetical protein